jgi:hypothetical protein
MAVMDANRALQQCIVASKRAFHCLRMLLD